MNRIIYRIKGKKGLTELEPKLYWANRNTNEFFLVMPNYKSVFLSQPTR